MNAVPSPTPSRSGTTWPCCAGLLLFGLAGPALAAPAPSAAGEMGHKHVIRACGRIAEWPPYTYFRRDFGVVTEELTGYSVDMLKNILGRSHLTLSLDLIPWKRCMAGVESGLYDMMVDVSTSAERERLYLVSQPYYTLHLAYFYDMDRTAPAIHNMADLKKYRLCGVRSYNYAPFRLSDKEVDMGSLSLAEAFVKLKHQRCDLVPDRLEVALGYKLINVVDMNKLNIGYGQMPGSAPLPFRMMVSRRVSYADELLHLLDDGISTLLSNGEAKALGAKYSLQGLQIGINKADPGDK